MAQAFAAQQDNKAVVQASFDRWRDGTGGPFELLSPDAEWTIVGSSPLSKTYHSRKEFLDEVARHRVQLTARLLGGRGERQWPDRYSS